MTTIHHLALAHEWERALATGSYEQSTIGRTLQEEGFIHASSATQWPVVRRAFYASVTGSIVLLDIDTDLLISPVVYEVGNAETGEQFPHIYGPVNVDAVVATTVLEPPHG